MPQKDSEKISKACDPCRSRKIRCDGGEPCQNCRKRPVQCQYRTRIRTRKLRRHSAIAQPEDNSIERRFETNPGLSAQSEAELEIRPEPGLDQLELYRGVTATHSNGNDRMEGSCLFYGPSSHFAFLQLLYRRLRSCPSTLPSGSLGTQESGPTLALFKEQDIFFGSPLRLPNTSAVANSSPSSIASFAEALELLATFKVTCHLALPLFDEQELDRLVGRLYAHPSRPRIAEERALALIIIATGALCYGRTDQAELLYTKAKQEFLDCDDRVNLKPVSFSLLLADYQKHMGRMHAAYLTLGSACREAFAMGLHHDCNGSSLSDEVLRKRRTTLWCLYVQKGIHSLALGRQSGMKGSNVLFPSLPEQPVFAGMCRLAQIAEDVAKRIYGHRCHTLEELYAQAEVISAQLSLFSHDFGVGAVRSAKHHDIPDGVAALQVHNMYYWTTLLTYRPFIIAEGTLQTTEILNPASMWLRKACRIATDAAKDAILYISGAYRKFAACKTMRYNGFFLDAACIVLIYDVIRNPAKYTETVQYIDTALDCFGEMTQDEPIVHCKRSIQQILRVVTQTIFTRDSVSLRSSPLRELRSMKSIDDSQHLEQTQSNASLDMPFEPVLAQFDTYCLPTWGYDDHLLSQVDQVDSITSNNEAIPFQPSLGDVVTSDLSTFFSFN